jgi:deoxyhypusine synthase
LSGATPSEAVSWGKIDPSNLPDCVVAYVDTTVALPLLTAYCLSRTAPRPLKRLYGRRDELLQKLTDKYMKCGSVNKIAKPSRAATKKK